MAVPAQPELTEQELLAIIRNSMHIALGTHPSAGPEWAAVALLLTQAAQRELHIRATSKDRRQRCQERSEWE